MKEIELTRGMVAILDDEDFDRLGSQKWHAHETGPGIFYALRHSPESRAKKLYLHREVLGVRDHRKVDHVNGNRLDCRRENLRICTLTQNQGNRRKNRTSSSRFKGVSRHRAGGWSAQITKDYVNRKIGHYSQEEDAARAYDAAAREYFGEFARVNFPRNGEQQA